MRRIALITACFLLGLTATACGSDSFKSDSAGGSKSVTVVGQQFTEADVMTQLYKLVLEKAGYSVKVKNFGTRDIYLSALQNNDVQVAADYLSSLTEALNKKKNGADAAPVASNDQAATVAKLGELAADYSITPLDPAQAQDANAYAVTQAYSDANGVTKLSDLAGKTVTLAANSDCPERADCAKGLEQVYGIKIAKVLPLGFGSAETKNALIKGEVQLGQVGTSDATLKNKALVILQDDKAWQNAENLVPVVNSTWLKDNPKAKDALNALSAALTTADLAVLNGKVDIERELPADAAKAWLTDKGLL